MLLMQTNLLPAPPAEERAEHAFPQEETFGSHAAYVLLLYACAIVNFREYIGM